ncbi:MAG: DMT family transporter [Burkholderiales bacterium]|nr:MAG: DMT family transporter [Burkholderiales bacterium]
MEFFNRLSPKTIGITSAIITIAVWTSFIVVARFMALKSLTPLDIVLCRIVGAALVLLPWGYFMVRKMRAENPQAITSLWISPLPLKLTVTLGLFGGVGYAVLAYSAFTFAPAAHGSVLMPGLLPLSTALLSVLLLGEMLNRGRKMGLLLILCGGVLVGGASIWQAYADSASGSQVWKGDLLFVCASSCWAFYTVLCRKHKLEAVPTTIAVIVFCVLAYIPLYALLVGAGVLVSKFATAPLWEILFQTFWQGLGSVVISGIAFTQMIRYFGPVRSTMITALVPGLSALGAVIFLGEPLGWNLMVGLGLVTIGIIVGVRAASAPKALVGPAKA